jgi:hypothetical protein
MADITAGQLKVLESLIGDEGFRKGFFEGPEAALAQAGLELSEEELAALQKIDQTLIDSFLFDVEERLSKQIVVPV